jgi:hypothetical protein
VEASKLLDEIRSSFKHTNCTTPRVEANTKKFNMDTKLQWKESKNNIPEEDFMAALNFFYDTSQV